MQALIGPKMGFIRYADDFSCTARTKEQIEAIKPVIEGWLAERGLALNHEKTRIVSVDDGFNFLGFNVRHYHGKCLIKPEKAKVLNLLRNIRKWLSDNKQAEAAQVIRYLNPLLSGWANYYQHAVSKQTFSYVSHQVWKALWIWCLRRHPQRGQHWVKRRYFRSSKMRDWVFFAKTRNARGEMIESTLFNIQAVPITRHVKVRGNASPDNPSLREYWSQRRKRKIKADTWLLRNNHAGYAASVLLMA
jgi:RNA-directed DNA polymerase